MQAETGKFYFRIYFCLLLLRFMNCGWFCVYFEKFIKTHDKQMSESILSVLIIIVNYTYYNGMMFLYRKSICRLLIFPFLFCFSFHYSIDHLKAFETVSFFFSPVYSGLNSFELFTYFFDFFFYLRFTSNN